MNLKHIFSHTKFPKKQEIEKAVQSFSKKQKIIFFVFLAIFFISAVELTSKILLRPFQNETAVDGGIHKEGSIGSPRFVNPVLALSNTDTDIESLVFAGLSKKTKEGSIVLDLAEDFSVSKDNLVYTFTLRDDIRFHDNTPITAEDVVFTISYIQNPETKSPKRINWDDVRVEKIDDQTVRFTLTQPFIGFLEQTTLGIMPSHIWKEVAIAEFAFSPFNIDPVGSGPYQVQTIKKSKDGVVESYTLKQAKTYQGEQPKIKKIYFYFFGEDDTDQALRAFKKGTIDALSGISPEDIKDLPKSAVVYPATLQRMFGIFFYQDAPSSPTTSKSVREAISLAIDRDKIINEVFLGFADPLHGPLLTTLESKSSEPTFNQSKAVALLESEGWTKGAGGMLEKNGVVFEITLTTAKTHELEQTALLIQEDLREVGISVLIESLALSDLNQYVVRPRRFEMLLFGNILNHESDIFAFWHSSQTKDPGLNITGYKNKTVDGILEKILQTFDDRERQKLYQQFETEFNKDIPAVFLYSPQLIYAVRDTLHNVTLAPIINSSQRLLDIESWYKETNYTFTR